MTLLQLQYFRALARNLHYTKTADELHITQPSLSYAISGLEEELGVKLFEKKNRKTLLTSYGEQYLPYVEQALNSLDEGRAVLDRMSNNVNQTVRLGYFQSISASLIPSVVESFYENPDHKAIRFSFSEASTAILMQNLRNGVLDMAFTLQTEDWAESICILRQPLYLAVPRGHRLSGRTSVTFDDFAAEPLIMLEKSSTLRNQMEESYRRISKVPNLVFEVRECNVALQYVSLKFGLAVVPQISYSDSDKVDFIPISENDREYARQVYLARSRYRVLTPSAFEVWNHIEKTLSI
ncbi:MAG: LysR family transcriptional regulator [Oscillospiraceae bacterium]|nr:LysR family transcriptional regulator [Oscillospiraceae bacterium]